VAPAGAVFDAAFRTELARLAAASGRTPEDIRQEAERDLREMYCRRNSLAVKTFAALSRLVYRRGYPDELIYDRDDIESLRAISRERSIVYLVTHKTYLDFFVLFDFLHRQGLQTPYVFGGINMDFAVFGSLARHAGGIFIRRRFRDDPVYKAVLQHYVETLVGQGAPFMWAIEGTRSRTGKLLRPRLGLLNYMVRAGRARGMDAIRYIPVSVAYDQIPDVVDMAAQEAGTAKKPESLTWFVRYLRGLEGPFGSIYIRFGEAIAWRDTPDAPDLRAAAGQLEPERIELQKLAFEVCYRINDITPPTPTSLVIVSLLCRGRCRTAQIERDVDVLGDYVRRTDRHVVMRRPSRVSVPDTAETIAALTANGVIRSCGNAAEPDVEIVPERMSVALYYGNMAVHHFIVSAFSELSLAACACLPGGLDPDEVEARCGGLRELFKFEFFFARKAVFRDQVRGELASLDPGWAHIVRQGEAAIASLLRRKPMRIAQGLLAPYLAAYHAVAHALVRDAPADDLPGEDQFRHCVEAGWAAAAGDHQERPAVSREVIRNGVRLAENRGLLGPGTPDVVAGRKMFLDELEALQRALSRLRQLGPPAAAG
jgi:glycerol-3-phosphate O-acyltransferase